MAELAQQIHELGLATHAVLANDFREHHAARRCVVVFGLGPKHLSTLHKIARMLHKNADAVNRILLSA
jgi:hypothetical protein